MPSYVRAVLVDSGFVVALFSRHEPTHEAAVSFAALNQAPLVTIQGVITEACFFLRPKGRQALLEWVARGGIQLIDVPTEAYRPIAALMHRHVELDPDFVDCALVWLAGHLNCRRVLTLDRKDFEVLRLRSDKHFDLIDWQTA